MGRKRKFNGVVYLRMFNEGEKLTEEQKAWLLKKPKKGESNDGKRSNISKCRQTD